MVTPFHLRARTEVVTVVRSTSPTHKITHRGTNTTALVPLDDRIHKSLATGTLADNDEKYVAMAFKNTAPTSGPDMSDEYVAFNALSIQRLPWASEDPEYGEQPVRMGPGGVVLDDSDYGEE